MMHPVDSPQLDALCAHKATVVIDATGPTIVWKLVATTPTAGHHVRTVTLGSSVLSVDVPNVRFDTQAFGANLEQLYRNAHVPQEVMDQPLYTSSQQAHYRARDEPLVELGRRWVAKLVDVCDRAEPLDEHSRETCTTCDGVGMVNTSCWCTLGQSCVHTQLDGTEKQAWLRAAGVDPHCDTCAGSGQLPPTVCDVCHGLGSINCVPTLTLNTSEGSQTVGLDLKTLVRNKLVTVSAHTASYETWAQITLQFDTAALYEHLGQKHLTSPLVTVGPQVLLKTELVRTKPLHFRFMATDGKYSQNFDQHYVAPHLLHTPEFDKLLTEEQHNLAYTFSWFPLPCEKFFTGVVEGRNMLNGTVVGLEAEELPWEGVQTSCEHLAVGASARGLTVGLTQSFFATGETAPAVFLLKNGKTVAPLGHDHVWACALAHSIQLLKSV